jgi:hypothetical protein
VDFSGDKLQKKLQHGFKWAKIIRYISTRIEREWLSRNLKVQRYRERSS